MIFMVNLFSSMHDAYIDLKKKHFVVFQPVISAVKHSFWCTLPSKLNTNIQLKEQDETRHSSQLSEEEKLNMIGQMIVPFKIRDFSTLLCV